VEGLLPAIAEVRTLDEGAARLRRVLDLLGDEAAADRPGGSLVMERLLELMLIEVMRRGPVPAGAGRPNLLAGLADPRIAAALAAMHADIGRSWTVEQLAAVAGMSRSVFAQRFSRRLGLPPIDYLLRWRMAQAKDALRLGRASLAEVALGAGYSSVSAFSAAFSRTVGRPPSRYAAEAFQAEA
jgi:transcriptional regulator GlxA family with amidase domain